MAIAASSSPDEDDTIRRVSTVCKRYVTTGRINLRRDSAFRYDSTP